MVFVYIGVVILLVVGLYRIMKSKSEVSPSQEMSVEELMVKMKKKDIVLIDVRTSQEISHGHIGDPLMIELGVSAKSKLMKLDKDLTYVVYCRSGRRSAVFCNIMNDMGFTDVYNLSGGYVAWKSLQPVY